MFYYTNKFKIGFLLVFCSLLFSNCKKGKDDPSISLLSRKTRLTGEWNMTRGNANFTYRESGQPTINQAFSFQGASLTLNETETSGPPIIYTGSYTLWLKMGQKGEFEMTENLNGSIFSASGTWNFTGKVGENKNKEEVVFIINSVRTGASNEHLFNKLRTEFTYKLIALHIIGLVHQYEEI